MKTIPSRLRDRITGATLLAVALVWIVLVYTRVETGEGAAAGSRTFPLIFGVFLAFLALIVLAGSFLGSAEEEEEPDAEPVAPNEGTSLVVTIGVLVAYAFLLQPLGFILSTVLVVAGLMIFLLRIRSPLLIAALSLGLAVGCYLVFGKLLGTYLPAGTLYPIYF